MGMFIKQVTSGGKGPYHTNNEVNNPLVCTPEYRSRAFLFPAATDNMKYSVRHVAHLITL